jgi:hypothetical protein
MLVNLLGNLHLHLLHHPTMRGTYISPACTATSTAQPTVGVGLPDRRGREYQADSAGSEADVNSLVADLQQDGFVMGGITTYSVVSSKMWSFELCVSGESVVTGRLHHFYGNRRSLWWYLTTASWSNPAMPLKAKNHMYANCISLAFIDLQGHIKGSRVDPGRLCR